jgi:hypothetical protein
MASINLTELHTIGSALFQDSESFLTELHNIDDSVYGGDSYSSSTNAVIAFGVKGFEFGAITFGIDAIGHLVKSFSDNNGY